MSTSGGTHTTGTPPHPRAPTPCSPADGEDGDLAGAAGLGPGFGGLGGINGGRQHLGPLLLAAAGAGGVRGGVQFGGRAVHRVQVLLVPARGGKLRQEVQPAGGGQEMPGTWGGGSVGLGGLSRIGVGLSRVLGSHLKAGLQPGAMSCAL